MVSRRPDLNRAGFRFENSDPLTGEESKAGKRGPAPKLQRQMERIQELPKPKQRFVMEMIDTVIAQAGR